MASPQPNLKFILDTLDTIQNNTPTEKDIFMNDLNAQDATKSTLDELTTLKPVSTYRPTLYLLV